MPLIGLLGVELVGLQDAQRESEFGAAARRPEGPHPPAHRLDEAATHEQADA